MAEVFGAVGTGIAILDLILKRTKTISRLKNDVKGATSDIARRRKDLELRSQILENLRSDLDPSTLKGSPAAVSCLDSCAVEIRQLKATLKLFEAQLAPGQGWWMVLQAKFEYAWKKEEVEDLYKNVCSADQVFSDALAACQWYLAEAMARGVNEIRLSDLPPIANALQDIRTHDLPPITKSLNDIRTQDVPRITTSLGEITSQSLPMIADSMSQTRTQDLPKMSNTITSAVTSNTGHVIRLIGADGQHIRDIVVERGRRTSREVGSLETSIRQMLVSNRAELEASLLQPIQQHVEGFTEVVVQELRTFQKQTTSSTSLPSCQGPSAFPGSPTDESSKSSNHMRTKQTATPLWGGNLRLGIGTISLRREIRQRILIQIREYDGETDTSINTETIYTLGFIPNSWLFPNSMTGCDWKFTSRTSRRINKWHPVWDTVADNNVKKLIKYLKSGKVSINDVQADTGDSLLHYAASGYCYELCTWLVDNGIDTHATNDRLETAVFSLVSNGVSLERTHRENNWLAQDVEAYDPLMNFLVDRCQLDPNDKNKDGRSVMEAEFEGKHERFARLLQLSMPLCTEPAGDRIRELFHSIASEKDHPSGWMRLRWLLEEYERTDHRKKADDQTWWHTTDFLWRLAEQVGYGPAVGDKGICDQEKEEYEKRQEEKGLWVETQLLAVIRSDVDLHHIHAGQTILDTFTFNMPETEREFELQIMRTLRWFEILHRAVNVNLQEYLENELCLHTKGELTEAGCHYDREYPIFAFNYSDALQSAAFSKAVAILDPATTASMPGTWETDPEVEFCERQGLELKKRKIDWKHGGVTLTTVGNQKFHAEFEGRAGAEEDEYAYDWELDDERAGTLFQLWALSTAGFESGDYSLRAALRYRRDFSKHPVWMESTLPKGSHWSGNWLALGYFRNP